MEHSISSPSPSFFFSTSPPPGRGGRSLPTHQLWKPPRSGGSADLSHCSGFRDLAARLGGGN
uniref:Uncharacterized protein n=1 Tax=Arundo donax TaxID=35708 RepID=A0A0A9C9I8_ARUDO